MMKLPPTQTDPFPHPANEPPSASTIPVLAANWALIYSLRGEPKGA